MPTLVIDSKTIPFRPGESILDAAAAAGVYVPHLCHEPGFAPHGSCKLCTVRVDGKPAAACTTRTSRPSTWKINSLPYRIGEEPGPSW